MTKDEFWEAINTGGKVYTYKRINNGARHGQMKRRRTKNEQKTNNERGAEGEKVDLRGSY